MKLLIYVIYADLVVLTFQSLGRAFEEYHWKAYISNSNRSRQILVPSL